MVDAATMIPVDADLPGERWLAIDEGFGSDSADDHAAMPGGLIDCVGPGFPESAVIGSASSPHFVRPPTALVHGIGVRFASEADAAVAHEILSGSSFAECLGRSVAADLEAGTTDAQLLGVELTSTVHGHSVRFTGGDEHGVRPVNLDVAAVRSGDAVGVLWCGDAPDGFPEGDVAHLLGRIRARAEQ